jgi:pyridoxal/pyridoxine/pyridoxamine kinase
MSCVPAELPAFVELAPHLAVISPNLLELQSLLSIQSSKDPSEDDVVHAVALFESILGSKAPVSSFELVDWGRIPYPRSGQAGFDHSSRRQIKIEW